MFALKRRNWRRALAALAWLGVSVNVLAGPAFAQSGRPDEPDSLPVYALPPVEVVGRAPSLTGEGVLLASSVVEGRSLERAGVLGLPDALAPLPGVRVARFGAPGSFSMVSIRGTRNEQILVLVDGRRLSPAQGGGVDLGAVDAASLERVEVLRGGASALYGGGALGGVVNLVTRPPAGWPGGSSFRLEGGSFGTVEGMMRHERALGAGGRLWLRGHGLTTRGDYAYFDRGAEVERKNARARSSGGTVGLRLAPSPHAQLTLDGVIEAGEQGVPGAIEFPTLEAERTDHRGSAAAELVLDDRGATGNRIALSGQWLRQRRNYSDREHGIADRHINRSAGIDVRLDHSLSGTRGLAPSSTDPGPGPAIPSLTGGVDLTWDDLDSTTDGDRSRRSAGLYLRGQFGRDRLIVAPAARLDAASDAAPSLNPRLGLRVDLDHGLDLRLAAGRSYRPPSFDDLFFPDVGGAMGNPNLRPERALDLEMGVGGGFGRPPRHDASFAVNAYRQQVDDLIQWSPGADGRWRPHNVGRAVVEGIEAETRISIPTGWAGPSEIVAALDLLDPRNRTGEPNVDGRRLPYRPAVEGHLELVVPASSRLRVTGAWQGIGRSFATEANTKSIPGHGLLDLTLELVVKAAPRSSPEQGSSLDRPSAPPAGDRLVLSVAVLNLADIAAVDVRDYPLPGREWRLGLRFAAREE